jgi:hypothetical protein
MLPKPNKRDLTSARAWRPISLLSCLGKGLERLVARRLAWASIHRGVLHPQQCGALPKRSATDLVAALVHDIEEAFARGQVATLVTMDVQGAFDTVMRKRLARRLREQGWPAHLVRWVYAFMEDRSASVRYQDITTPSSPLQCGLPQGSPVSPVLFLLYTEPIYRLGDAQGRSGYADDVATLSVGDSAEATVAEATRKIDELVAWGAANGIAFDPDKTEVIHFSRRPARNAPAIRHGDHEKQPGAALRWLGIWLDPTLSFKTHVEKWTAKARAVAYHLKGLTNTERRRDQPVVGAAVERAAIEDQRVYPENGRMSPLGHTGHPAGMGHDTGRCSPPRERHPSGGAAARSRPPTLRGPPKGSRRGTPTCGAHSSSRAAVCSRLNQAKISTITQGVPHPPSADGRAAGKLQAAGPTTRHT